MMMLAAAFAASLAATAVPVEVPGPQGLLKGTLLLPAPATQPSPAVLIIPGSGPTDRDGNNPLGIQAASYRLLAEALAERGIASVRIDKRGMFGSAAAVADANAATIADYADDAASWIAAIRGRTGAPCVWIAGHSEGGIVALAARGAEGVCGLILIAAPGRPVGEILREQLRANPANAPLLDAAEAAIATLEAGGTVDPSGFHPALQALFASQTQGFLRNLMAQDPAAMAADHRGPLLILQGQEDLQVTAEDAQRLKAAAPAAALVLLPGVNHVLKAVPPGDRAANGASYADPSLPLAPGIADAIAGFIAAGEAG